VVVGRKLEKDDSGTWVEAWVDNVSASEELALSLPPAVSAGGVPSVDVVGDRLELLLAILTHVSFRICGLCQYCGAASITT